MTTVRTRFAPSPTGFMHVGGVRTALFAYLVARQAQGKLVMRIEDTDKTREVAGSAEHLTASLAALGIDYDEGPDRPGEHGPYIQSERLAVYQRYAAELIKQGRAYADPYTGEQMQNFRDQAKMAKKAFRYRDFRPENPPAWDGSTPLRFKSDPKSYTYRDQVMGETVTSPEVVDDFILIKSDGYPTYNFAHIVDDLEMKISHVIRGQEFISSMPNYLNLYEALGFAMHDVLPDRATTSSEGHALPTFAHLPHIMNEQGNKKLGKRDGAKDVLDYLEEGYLPEALVSFIATLGWNDGTEQEVFTRQELIDTFSLDRVQRSGARFDQRRLLWVNGQVIRTLDIDTLHELIKDFWPESAQSASGQYRTQVLALAQDRLKTLADLPALSEYFFTRPTVDLELITGNKQLKKLDAQQLTTLLADTITAFETLKTWRAEPIQDTLNTLLEQTAQKPAVLFGIIRIAITWAQFSPQLPDTLELLGRDEVMARLTHAMQAITKL